MGGRYENGALFVFVTVRMICHFSLLAPESPEAQAKNQLLTSLIRKRYTILVYVHARAKMAKSPKVTLTSRVDKSVKRAVQRAARAGGVSPSAFVATSVKMRLAAMVIASGEEEGKAA
jgi:hypothetical protein